MAVAEKEFSRRIRIDLLTPPETAIREAMLAVEAAGAHPLLTDAVGLLGQAREKVADYIEINADTVVEQKTEAFLAELTALSRKYGLGINRSGEIYLLESSHAWRKYRCDSDSRITFV